MENETKEDYLARLNIEGQRKVWLGNHPKIGYPAFQTTCFFVARCDKRLEEVA